MWFYVQEILIAHQRADAARNGIPRGNLSDLYPRWLGARELLLQGRNPYSPQTTLDIEEGYYGRPLDPIRPNDPRDEQGFAYPVYVVLLLAPTVHLPFSIVRIVFIALLTALTLASIFWWLRALDWNPTRPVLAGVLILTLGSFQFVQGIKLQQLTLLVAALVAACAALLVSGRLFWAGVLLAVSTIKPQIVTPLALFLVLWCLVDWHHRRHFLWGFAGTMAALLAGSQLLLPTWIADFWHALGAYRRYTRGRSVLDVLLGPSSATLVALAVFLAVVWLSWRWRREGPNSSRFLLTFVLVLTATLAVIPTFAIYNQILLLPVILIALRHVPPLIAQRPWIRLITRLMVAVLAWQWVATLGLMIAAPLVSSDLLQRAWSLPLWLALASPLAALVLLVPMIEELIKAHQVSSPLALGDRTG